MNEVWKSVPAYDGLYEVSSMGRVKSLGRSTTYPAGGVRIFPERMLKPRNAKGYRHVSLTSRDKKVTQVSVHTLVASAFLGERPGPNYQVDHINGVKSDNRLLNLEWVTNCENMKRAHNKGLVVNKCVGERINSCRLTEEKVIEIIKMDELGVKRGKIAEDLGVVASTVTSICRGQTWGWLTKREKVREKRNG